MNLVRSQCLKARPSKVESVAKATNSLNLMSTFRTLMHLDGAIFAVRIFIAARKFTTAVASQTMNVVTTVVQNVWTMLQSLETRKKSPKFSTFVKNMN